MFSIFFGKNKHELSVPKQKQVSLETFDEKKYFIDKNNSVPWSYNPTS